MTGRHAQLSYTSYDAGRGAAGGWQIKQTIGELTDDESRRLMAELRTVLTPAQPLPDYPTPEQLAAAPRRLAYRDGCYWHTARAGIDATGRPGNVFVHALLDRSPTADPVARPVQRWGSPDWLSPYGQAAVAEAELPETAPRLSEVISRKTCLGYVLDPQAWRLTTLLVLLDAVAAAMAGGPPVLLGTESPDTAALWIGTVSFLMAARTATTLSFSTFDRVSEFNEATAFHLAAVPVTDLETPIAGVVTIDTTAAVAQLGQLDGQPHLTSTGHAVPATAWSSLAQVVLLEDADIAADVLIELDGVAAAAGDTAVHPMWPLAVVVAADQRFSDAAPEAHRVIAAYSPDSLAAGTAHATITAATVAHLCGSTTADAWHGVQQCTAAGPATLAGQTYLLRAIADPDWLDQPGTIPVPAMPAPGTAVSAELAAAIGPALDNAGRHGPVRLIRLMDLLYRAGLNPDRRYGSALDRHVPVLSDENDGPAVIKRLGPNIEPSIRLIVATAVFTGSTHFRPIAEPVRAWLAVGQPAPTFADAVAATPGDPVWTRAALAGAHLMVTTGPSTLDNPLGLWWLRERNARVAFEKVAAARPWPPEVLLTAAGDIPLSATVVLPTLLGTPDSDGLRRLCQVIASAHVDPVADAFAQVRLYSLAEWAVADMPTHRQARFAKIVDDGLRATKRIAVHTNAAERLLGLSVIAAARRQPYSAVCAGWRDKSVDDEVVEAVAAILSADPTARRRAIALHLLGGDAESDLDAADAEQGSARRPGSADGRPDAADIRDRGDGDASRWRARGRDKADRGDASNEPKRDRRSDTKRADDRPDHVMDLLGRTVERCAAAATDAEEAGAIAAMMSDITADTSDKAAKRYLRSATKLLSEQQKRPSLANRLRGNH